MKRALLLILVMMCCSIMTIDVWADPPANDDCANAADAGILVAGVPVQLTGTTVDATQDCMTGTWPEAWIKFTVSSCMDVTIDFCDDGNFVMEVPQELYEECPCNSASYMQEIVSCPNGNSSLTWTDLGVGTYYYAIYALNNEGGSYTVTITGVDCRLRRPMMTALMPFRSPRLPI